jgi:hypothetical protein
MNIVTIERNADDGLSGALWQFGFQDMWGVGSAIYLDDYVEFTRPSRRHKPRRNIARHYSRLENYYWVAAIGRGSGWVPPMPDDVVAEARQKFVQQITTARIVAPTQPDIDRIREASR